MYYDLNAMDMMIFSILHIFVIEWTLSEKDECIFNLGYSLVYLFLTEEILYNIMAISDQGS